MDKYTFVRTEQGLGDTIYQRLEQIYDIFYKRNIDGYFLQYIQ